MGFVSASKGLDVMITVMRRVPYSQHIPSERVNMFDPNLLNRLWNPAVCQGVEQDLTTPIKVPTHNGQRGVNGPNRPTRIDHRPSQLLSRQLILHLAYPLAVLT